VRFGGHIDSVDYSGSCFVADNGGGEDDDIGDGFVWGDDYDIYNLTKYI
jgi:hypothetical protein